MSSKIFKMLWGGLYLIYLPLQLIVMKLTGFSKAFANITVCVIAIFLWIFIGMVWRDATLTSKVALRPIQVKIEESIAKKISPNLYLPATLDTDNNAQVAAETSGRVIKTFVRNGDKVKKGQPLIELEGGNTKSQMESAKAQLKKATFSLKAEKQLAKAGLSSRANISLLDAQYNSALANYNGAKRNYDNTTVRSPLSGVVEDRLVNVGSFAKAGMSVITFLGSKRHKVVMNVALNVAEQIKVGTTLDIHLNNSKSIIPAKVVSIGRVTDTSTATIKIEAIPDGSEKASEWISGRPVTVNIHLPKVAVHEILQSVLQLDEKGRLGMYVIDKDIIRFKVIKIVDETEGMEYVTGLGDKIKYVGFGFSKLHDGMELSELLNTYTIPRRPNTYNKKTGLYWAIVRPVRKMVLAHRQKVALEALKNAKFESALKIKNASIETQVQEKIAKIQNKARFQKAKIDTDVKAKIKVIIDEKTKLLEAIRKEETLKSKMLEDSKTTDSKTTDSNNTDSNNTDSNNTDSNNTDSNKTATSKIPTSKHTDSKHTDSKHTTSKHTTSHKTSHRHTTSRHTTSRHTSRNKSVKTLVK